MEKHLGALVDENLTWSSDACVQPRLHQEGWKKGQSRWLSLSVPSLWGPIWNTACRPGAPAQKRCGPAGAGPEDGHEEHLSYVEREGACSVQPAGEKAKGRPHCGLPTFEGCELISKIGTNILRMQIVRGQVGMVLNSKRGDSGWMGPLAAWSGREHTAGGWKQVIL